MKLGEDGPKLVQHWEWLQYCPIGSWGSLATFKREGGMEAGVGGRGQVKWWSTCLCVLRDSLLWRCNGYVSWDSIISFNTQFRWPSHKRDVVRRAIPEKGENEKMQLQKRLKHYFSKHLTSIDLAIF